MSAFKDKRATLLELQNEDSSAPYISAIDENPVAKYAFFCEIYNYPWNMVNNQIYEVPNL